MAASKVTPHRRLLYVLLLLQVAGGGLCQTLLDPVSRSCRTKDNTDTAAATALAPEHRNEYPAGGVLIVLAKVPTGLFGSLQLFLCPDGEAREECLDKLPLQLADGSGPSYDLHRVSNTDNYEIPVILPEDVSCLTCTLQLRVLTRGCEDEEACPVMEKVTCADITVREIKESNKRIFGRSRRRSSRRRSRSRGSRRRSSRRRSRSRGSPRMSSTSRSEVFRNVMQGIESIGHLSDSVHTLTDRRNPDNPDVDVDGIPMPQNTQ